MTLDQLRIFLEVARRQHVTGAARALNRTQSAVSAAISALERRHDVRLFDRVGRDIRLTSDGERFIPAAQAVVAEADRAIGVLSGFAGEPAGLVRIVASQTVASYWLPPKLARFRSDFPQVEIRMTTLNTRRAIDDVLAGHADLGIVEGRASDPSLDTRIVGSDRLAVIVGLDHPWADERPLDISDLQAADWVIREVGSGTRDAFHRAMEARSASTEFFLDALVMPSNEACLAAVTTGQLATVVSVMAAEPHLQGGTLRMANFTFDARAFLSVTHARRHRSRAVEALLDTLNGT